MAFLPGDVPLLGISDVLPMPVAAANWLWSLLLLGTVPGTAVAPTGTAVGLCQGLGERCGLGERQLLTPKLHDRLFGLIGFPFQIIIACTSFQATMFPGAARCPQVVTAGLARHPLPQPGEPVLASWLHSVGGGAPKFH